MSSIYIEGYIQGKNEKSHTDLLALLNYIVKRDYSSILEKYPDAVPLLACDYFLENSSDKNLEIIEHLWSDLTLEEVKGVLHIIVDAPSSLDDEQVVKLLLQMNVGALEMYIYSSAVGEDTFYNLEEKYENYNEVEWKWLNDPADDDCDDIEESAIPSTDHQETATRSRPWWKFW